MVLYLYMALSNEDREEIRKMIATDQQELKVTILKQLREEIPKLFGRSMEQLRAFFISNIT